MDPFAIEQAGVRGLIGLRRRGRAGWSRLAPPLYAEVRRQTRRPPTSSATSRADGHRVRRRRMVRDDPRIGSAPRIVEYLDSDLKPRYRPAGYGRPRGAGVRYKKLSPRRSTHRSGETLGGRNLHGRKASLARLRAVMYRSSRRKQTLCSPTSRPTNCPRQLYRRGTTFSQAANELFALADPVGAEGALLDQASRAQRGLRLAAVPGTRFSTIYRQAMGRPARGRRVRIEARPAWKKLPQHVAQRVTGLGASHFVREVGHAGGAVGPARGRRSGCDPLVRSSSPMLTSVRPSVHQQKIAEADTPNTNRTDDARFEFRAFQFLADRPHGGSQQQRCGAQRRPLDSADPLLTVTSTGQTTTTAAGSGSGSRVSLRTALSRCADRRTRRRCTARCTLDKQRQYPSWW